MSTNESLIDQLIREKRDRPAVNVVGTVKDWYKKNIGADLPLANVGATDFHKSLRLEHSRAFDVGLDPRTREGQRLIGFLDQQGIPYLAFDRAIAGTSTGPHIHIGPPSQRGVSLVDRLVQEKEQFGEAPPQQRPLTAADRRGEYGARAFQATHPEKDPVRMQRLNKLAHDINWHFGYSVLMAMPKLPEEKQREIIEKATQFAQEDEEKKKRGTQIVESQLWKYRNQDLVGIREGKEIEVRQPPDVAAEMERHWRAYENPLMHLPNSVNRLVRILVPITNVTPRMAAETLTSAGGGLIEFGAGVGRLAEAAGSPGAKVGREFLEKHGKRARLMAAESQELSGRRKGTRIAQGVGSGLIEFAPLVLIPELGLESAMARIGAAALTGGAYTGTQAAGRGESKKGVLKEAAVGGATFGLLGVPLPGRTALTRGLSNVVIVGGGTTLINRATGQPWEDAAIHGLVMTLLNSPKLLEKVKVQEADGTERPATKRDIKGLLPAARFEMETVDSPLPSTLTTKAKGAGRVFTEAPGQQELFSGIAKPVDRAVGRADLPGEFPPVYTFEEFALSRGIDLTNPQNLPMKHIDIRLEPLYNAYRESVARGGGRGQGTVTETIPGRAVLDYGTFLHGFFGWIQGQGVDPVRLAEFPALLKKAADHYATNVAGNGDVVRTLAATYSFEPTQMIFPLPGPLGETRAAFSGARREAPEVAVGDATLREVASLSPEQQRYTLAELIQQRSKAKNLSVRELAKVDRQIAYLEQVVESLPAGPEKGVVRLSEQTARSNLETLKALRDDKPTWNALNKKQKDAIETQIKRYEEQSVGEIPTVEPDKVGDRGRLRYTTREQLDPNKVRLMRKEQRAQENLQQRGVQQPTAGRYGSSVLSGVPQRIPTGEQTQTQRVAGGTTPESQRPSVRQRLSAQGEALTEALRGMRSRASSETPRGLHETTGGEVVVSNVPRGTSRSGETPEQRVDRIISELRTENLKDFLKTEKGSGPDLETLRYMLTGKRRDVKELGSVERKRNVRPEALRGADQFVREQRAEQEYFENLGQVLEAENRTPSDVIDLTEQGVDVRTQIKKFLRDEAGTLKPHELRKRLNELLDFYEERKRAYHGSRQQVDRFTTQKIGTGEGNQTYGWGLYFTDNKNIAEFYKGAGKIGKWQWPTEKANLKFDQFSPIEQFLINWLSYPGNRGLNSKAEAITKLREDIGRTKTPGYQQQYRDAIKYLKSHPEVEVAEKGSRVYEVELAPKADEWLDWDKRLSEQSPRVQQQLQQAGVFDPTLRANEFYANLQAKAPGGRIAGERVYPEPNPRKASKFLRSIGIRGIRYYTGETRSKAGPKEYNYVLFDDKDVRMAPPTTRSLVERVQQFLKDEEGSFKPEELKQRIRELLKKNPNLSDAEIKAQLSRYKEPVEERHSGLPINIFRSRTPPDMPTAPKSLIPEVEARMKAAEGIQTPGVIQKTKEAVQGIYHSFKRTYPELDPNKSDKHAVVNDLFRRHEATPMYSKAVAFNRIAEVTENLGKNRMQAFSRALILPDILKDIQEGRYKDKELPFGYKSEADVRADMAHYDAIAKSEPAVADALQRRQEFVGKLVQELVDAELLSPEVLKDPRYYHRQVMEYVNDPAWIGTGSHDLRMHQKGFQKSRKGGGDFNTRYQEAEFEWVSQAISLLERKKTRAAIQQVADIMSDLEAQAALWNKTNVDKKTWRDFIPAGHVTHKPQPGGHFYPTLSMTERTMNKILSGSKTLEKGDLRRVMAVGKQEKPWVVPEEIAKTMDDFRPIRDEGPIERTWTKIQSTWKQAVLLLPTKVLKYNFNNLSGDLDIALAYDPKILRHFKRAAQDVWQHQVKGKASAEVEEAIRMGVVDSGLTLTEVPDINKAGAFRALASTNTAIVRDGINAYWSGVRNFTAWRENILRLSAYRYFKERLAKGDVVYGASNKEQVDAIRASQGNDAAAAKLARELVGDYGAVSTAGRWIRRHLIPFYSWIEINAPRYVRMIKNLPNEGGSPTGAVASKLAAMTGRTLVKGGALAIKAQLLMLAAATWNQTMFPDEEKELRKEGREPHLILGRSEDGSIRTIRLAGALADALDWFNLADYPNDIADLASGKKTPKAMVAEGVEAPPQKVVQSLEPVAKTAFEVATGRTTFPTVFSEGEEFFDFRTRPIRDRGEYIARVVALDELYRRVTHRPSPPTTGGSLFDLILTKRTDPGEAAYWEIRGKAADWSKKQGRTMGGGEPTERSNALYYYRQAIKWRDEDAAKYWLQEYKRLGGTEKGMTQSLRMGHPLGMLKAADDKDFKKTLSPEDAQMLEMAVKWYEGMFGKNLSREVRHELR